VLPTQVTGDPNNPVHAIDRIEFVVVDPKEQLSPKGSSGAFARFQSTTEK
jgi:hypothetical protein